LAFIGDEGREVLSFSLPEGWVDILRERVVRMLAAAAAAVAARVGMERATKNKQESQGVKRKAIMFFFFALHTL
jgi:hypothetical protein